MKGEAVKRMLPVGAEVLPEGGVHFRVWASRRKRVRLRLETGEGAASQTIEMEREPGGYFHAYAEAARAGSLYRFQLDDDDYPYPDPASRFQPEGPHGPSCVIDAGSFRWTDDGWRGRSLRGQVIYEMHVGTFTREGTWRAAGRELKELSALGVTVVEMMPVAEFPGRFGWGYDGVDLYAPTRLYGEPDDLRRFVDEAHRVGIAVILDVVYNHLGPDGNYLSQFSEGYFNAERKTEWGDALNFDGENSGPVREFFTANAGYWIKEFHMDGVRIDATQSIHDSSPEHILAAVTREVRASASGRETIIVGENEPQEVKMIRPASVGGYGLDGLWNDDFHHSARVALTGKSEAYYTDYRGRPQEFISALKWGYLYQGQRYKWQRHRRGTPSLNLKPEQMVIFMENHDQVANSGRGERVHLLTSPGLYRAMTALTLLAPSTPMLFQGQEFAASTPFYYFADHEGELASLVRKGRVEFLAQFRSIATPEMRACLVDPASAEAFEKCKLDFSERETNRAVYDMHKDLLKLRREDAVFSLQRERGVDGAVLGDEAFVLRFFGEDGDDRLMLVNMGVDLNLNPAPEPLLAPPEGRLWKVLWSSEDCRYNGSGTPPVETRTNWHLPGRAAVVLTPAPAGEVEDLAVIEGEESEEAEVRREMLARWPNE
ncbi:MAG TPA: malto-oligosyltrehalose trehalohydrolase [Pyrinomonadaceae bacterium]|nr:malto-oligosyltrehalose trehalohydrolase [Pyrinomonadaceae bacterium]